MSRGHAENSWGQRSGLRSALGVPNITRGVRSAWFVARLTGRNVDVSSGLPGLKCHETQVQSEGEAGEGDGS